MDEEAAGLNGNGSGHTQEDRAVTNPYIDGATGSKPPEIVAFELNMSPYANMPPNMSRAAARPSVEDEERPRRTKLTLVLMMLVIAVLVAVLALHGVVLKPYR